MLALWLKWSAFFRPVGGWKVRLLEARAGRNTWEVPGKPHCSKVVPFPVQWLPHRLALTDEDTEADHTRGFVFLAGTCVDSGKYAKIGEAVNCCRCGVLLHPTSAHMFAGFDPPYCSRCKWPIKLL